MGTIDDTSTAPTPKINPNKDSGGSREITYNNYNEDPIIIKKMVLPSKKEGYLLGETLRILVEIKNSKHSKFNKNMNGLNVLEVVDDDLGLINESFGYSIIEGLPDLAKQKLGLVESNYLPETKLNRGIKPSYIPKRTFLFNLSDDANISESLIYKLSSDFDLNWLELDPLASKWSSNGSHDVYEIYSASERLNWLKLIFDRYNDPGFADLVLSDDRVYKLRYSENGSNEEFYNENGVLVLYIDNLKPKESIIYWYDLKPKKSGIFDTESICRTYDSELSEWEDLSYPTSLEIKNPKLEFDVQVKTDKSKLYSSGCFRPSLDPDSLKIIYDLTYIGETSRSQCRNVLIELDKPSEEYFHFVDEDFKINDSLANSSSLCDYSNFDKYQTREIVRRIIFPNEGEYSIPGIWINGVHYTFGDKKILADSYVYRHMDYIFLIIAICSLLATALELHWTRKDLKKIAKKFDGSSEKSPISNSPENKKEKGKN